MSIYRTTTPEETCALGRRLGQTLTGGRLILFTGGMGVGKTTFCRGIAQGLACTDAVSSPTFAIANLYRGPIPFAHFDALRVAGPEDLESAGLYDWLDEGAVVAVEWSEQVRQWLPPPAITIDMCAPQPDERTITIEGAAPL